MERLGVIMGESVKSMITEDEIQKRVYELAAQINEDFSGKTVTIICVLKGAVVFMCDLAKRLDLTTEFDFIAISSYGDGTESSGIVKITKDLDKSVKGKDVLLIEDILDTGNTLKYIINYLNSQKPNSLKTCVLLDKPERRKIDGIHVDYIGFEIPNFFAVGYGLDYSQRYRNLPFIGDLRFE
jgi:hypoxanthine phosphoribosyltransferase